MLYYLRQLFMLSVLEVGNYCLKRPSIAANFSDKLLAVIYNCILVYR